MEAKSIRIIEYTKVHGRARSRPWCCWLPVQTLFDEQWCYIPGPRDEVVLVREVLREEGVN